MEGEIGSVPSSGPKCTFQGWGNLVHVKPSSWLLTSQRALLDAIEQPNLL